MKQTKTLRHHTLDHPLRSDRAYVAFEDGLIQGDLRDALRYILPKHTVPGITSLGEELLSLLEKNPVDHARIDNLLDKARGLSCKYRHITPEGNWAAFLLAILVFLGNGIYMEPRKEEAHETELREQDTSGN